MADKNPFDKFDPPPAAPNPFDKFDGQPESSGGLRRFVGDPIVTAGKGAVGAVEAAIGLGNLATGGVVGKAADAVGLSKELDYRKKVLDEYLTPEQRIANREVEQAEGVLPTLGALARNPSTIAHTAIEAMPAMAGGGLISRGIMAAAPKLGALGAGAVGEGAVTAGMTAEQIRQETPDRELTLGQGLLAAGAGALTAGIGGASGAIGRKLGLGDIETAMAGGANVAAGKGALRRGAEGMITEGLLEEAPQSAQEQIAQNLALGKPWDEGVAKAATIGAVTGAAMGGPFNLIGGGVMPAPPPQGEPTPAPLALPAPGQTTMPMGEGGAGGTNLEVEAAQMYANSIYAARAAHDAEAEALKAAGKEDQIAGLLPAPGAPLGNQPMGEGTGLTDFVQGNARQEAVDNAQRVYAARAQEEARLQKLAAQGPISGVAAAAIRSGLATSQQEARQGAVDEALGPKEGPLSMPGPATEPDQVKQKRLESSLKMAPFAPLNVAQAARARDPENWAVVPHPSGQGFALAPTSYLTEQQLKAVEGIQQPGGALPSPSLVVDQAGTARTPSQAQTTRQDDAAFQRTSVPKQMPFPTVEAAKLAADRRTAATGVEHEVVPHPTKRDSFSFRPVQGSQPFTSREQAPAVNTSPERVQETGQIQPDAQGLTSQPDQAAAKIDAIVSEAATSPANDRAHPTSAQAVAGNYKKAHIPPSLLHGLSVTIENPDGSVRIDKDAKWASGTVGHYGYLKRTKGADGDQVDVNVGPKPTSTKVFVVNQLDPKTGKFDEHKVMLGYETAAEAEAAYRANYPAEWAGFGSIQETDVTGLKGWLKDGDSTAEFVPNAGTTVPNEGTRPANLELSSPLVDSMAKPEREADPARVLGVKLEFDNLPAVVRDINDGESPGPRGRRAIAAAIKEAIRLGVPPVVWNGVSAFYIQPGRFAGGYNIESQSISITEDVLVEQAQGNDTAGGLHVGMQIHEVGHHISGLPDGTSFAAESPAFAVDFNGKRRIPNGPVITEAIDAFLSGGPLSGYLKYPLANWSAPSLSGMSPEVTTVVLQDEVFAQLFRLYFTNPQLMQRELPQGFSLIKGVVNGIRVESGRGIDGVRRAVRGTLRSWRPAGSGDGAVDRGAGRAAQDGARDGRAGAGLEGRGRVQPEAAAARAGKLEHRYSAGEGRGTAGSATADAVPQAGLRDGGGRPGGAVQPGRVQPDQGSLAGEPVNIRPKQPDAVTIVGVHYSARDGINELSGGSYGSATSQYAGEEFARVQRGHPSIRKRVYFYAQTSSAIPRPEEMVTGHQVYTATLSNVLDARSATAQQLFRQAGRDANGGLDMNAFEKLVVDAGYDGYYNPYFASEGAVVVLDANVPVKYLGTKLSLRRPKALEVRADGTEYDIGAERGERDKGRAAISSNDFKKIADDGNALGLKPKEIQSWIKKARETRSRFPASRGWAPLELVGLKSTPKPLDDGTIIETIDLVWKAIPYGFNAPPGSAKAPPKIDTAWAAKVADQSVKEIKALYARAKAGDKVAANIVAHASWYRGMVARLREKFGGQADFFADLLGAMSPNTPVTTNWAFAIDAIQAFSRGAYRSELEGFSDWVAAGNSPSSYPAVHKIRQLSGKLFGMNSTNGMMAMLNTWRNVAPGMAPKARNFAANLIGASDMATIDVWAARFLRRMADGVRGASFPRIPVPAEKGVTGKWDAKATKVTGEFGFGANVLQQVSTALKADGIDLTAPDLQAVAWFVEKELWTTNAWTSTQGEGGSFEQQDDDADLRRYLSGVSIQKGDNAPSDPAMQAAAMRMLAVTAMDDDVVAARALPTVGRYAGSDERSFDAEITARSSWDPDQWVSEIARIAKENGQIDVFVSRVIRDGENNPNARPGIEVYFKKQLTKSTIAAIEKVLNDSGEPGFTLTVDPREARTNQGEEPGNFGGLRIQYVPEISLRYGDEALAAAVKEGPDAVRRIMDAKRIALVDLAAKLRDVGDVAYANAFLYDTVVFGQENYDEYTQGEPGVDAEARGDRVWFGTPAHEGLARAARRYEQPQAGRNDGDVLQREAAEPAEEVGDAWEPPVEDDALEDIDWPLDDAPKRPSTLEVRGFEPPKKTVKAYKLFRTKASAPGQIFPLFIGNNNPTPVGSWVPAENIPTKGFAQRPGWHAGVLPAAPHLRTKEGRIAPGRVWAEVELPADKDWQAEADKTSTRDIRDRLPEGGHYRFRTSKMQGGAWIIGGALKVNRILSDDEVRSILTDAGQAADADAETSATKRPRILEVKGDPVEPLWESGLQLAIRDKAPFAKNGSIAVPMLKSWLGARTKDGLVKADELKWSGVEEWLDVLVESDIKTISRDEVTNFIAKNGVQVEDKMLGDRPPPRGNTLTDVDGGGYLMKNESLGIEAYGETAIDAAYQMVSLLERRAKQWQKNGDDSKAQRYFSRAEEVSSWAESYDGKGTGEETRFSSYVLPGGTNYKELLLTLPFKATDYTQFEAREVVRRIGDITRTGYAVFNADSTGDYGQIGPTYETRAEAAASARQYTAHAASPDQQTLRRGATVFSSSHFDQTNILAHIRFNERTDADGKRVLFLEEIQSDWAQKGRKEGFSSPEDVAKVAELTKRLDELKAERNKLIDGSEDAAEDPPRLREVMDEISALAGQRQMLSTRRTAVPSAPFVGKTEAWVALALKRMIRYAADNGFDAVAWTNGDQQADRYDLSKQIDTIKVTRNPNGTWWMRAGKAGDSNAAISEPSIPADKLEDYVGKDLASKIVTDFDSGNTGDGAYKTYSGIDLQVGGEGMRAFYDKIVPNVANDLLKKLGGGRVGEVALGGHGYGIQRVIGKGWQVVDARNLPVNDKTFRDQQAALRWVVENDPTRRQPGFELTPEMRPAAKRPARLFVNAGLMGDIQDRASDWLKTSKTFNIWHKTVGTQYHKAQVDADFKPVYDGVQNFLNDSSQMMMEAAELAPDLLPRLSSLKDIAKAGPSKKVLQKVSDAVFEGTLNDKVWTDAELRQRGLDDKEIGIYRQARSSIDRVLSEAFASEAVKQARDLLPQAVLDQAKEAGDGWIIVSALSALPMAQRTPMHQQVYDQLRLRAAKISDLQRDGYAPLMRFGQYTVTIKDAQGETVMFTMHESEREANEMARKAKDDPQLQGHTVTSGVMSQEAWKLFQGVSPDALELFAEAAGMSNDQAVQSYIKLAANQRSVLKRLLKRGKIAGFNDDVQRTLAQFITSAGRAAAKNYHWGDVLKAAEAIPKEKGDVKDEAVRLVEYMQGGGQDAGALRGLLFVQFLGGSVASAAVNATQPMLMSFPYLARFGGAVKAAARLAAATKVALGGQPEAGLDLALKKADEQGITDPHEVAGLYAESIRNFGSNMAVRRGLKAWGSLFSLAEAFNRRITFVAAYRTAQAEGIADPYQFAVNAIAETQGVYNKGNRPDWARGAVGATLMTFKQYSISYVEFLKRLPPKERALALAVLVLAAGLQGLPGADDAEDVIDTIAESLGYNFNSKQELREFAIRTATAALGDELGMTVGSMLTNGFSALPGVPLDVQARLGVGNLIPGTSLLKRSQPSKSQEILEFFGPAGGQARSLMDAFDAAQSGDKAAIGKALVPLAIRNALKGLEMDQTGWYTDTKGRRVIDVDRYEAAIKSTGFQPSRVARQSRILNDLQQTINLQKDVESRIAETWARGIFEKDPEKVQKARAELVAWNVTNPEARVLIAPSQIARRVQQMMQTREQRFLKATPSELKRSVLEAIR